MIEAISETTVRAAVIEPAVAPPAADRLGSAGSAGFDDAMAGALRPPGGGCQCDAAASMASQSTAAPTSRSSPLASVRSELFSGGDALVAPTSLDRFAPVSPKVGQPSSCGSCGLPFSLDDVGESAIGAPVATATKLVGILTGVTFAGPTRAPRPAIFEV